MYDAETDKTYTTPLQEVKERTLDKTLADSFPASDPPSTLPNPTYDDFDDSELLIRAIECANSNHKTVVTCFSSTDSDLSAVGKKVTHRASNF